MSQNKKSLALVKKLAGRDILRPLSAKLLLKTKYEQEGLVDRSQLLSISGRGRKEQMKLIKKLGIEYKEGSSGGCRLTEPGYSNKFRLILEKFPNDILPIDAELIKYGKLVVFDRGYAILGRDQENNDILDKITPKNNKYKKIKLVETTGPLCVLKQISRQKIVNDIIEIYKNSVPKLKNIENISFQEL